MTSLAPEGILEQCFATGIMKATWRFRRCRNLVLERTRAGAKAAQRRGVKIGRKVKLTPEQIEHARKLIENGEARQY